MIDHLGLQVASYARSKAFYTAALAPLGYGLVEEHSDHGAFGPPGAPLFWVRQSTTPHRDVHVAFQAADRAAVAAFHAAALAAGATDNGPPGLRAVYHPHYFGAFVLDPDGNNVEAVCHRPP
jgi:catechol 2,3-dioxygenase-like lactoylglutathione lyase family enzyme